MSLLRVSASAGWLMVAVGVTSVGAASCVSGRHEASPVARSAASTRPWCGRMHPGRGARPLADVRESSTVALVHDGTHTFAYVADADDTTVHVIDLDRKEEASAVLLDGSPSQLVVAADGRVIVGLRDKASVEVLEPTGAPEGTLERRCVVEAPAEPVALAIAPDDATVLVTGGWGHKLAALDMRTLEARWDVDVPREPRAVVISDDGKKAFLSHAVGAKMSVVDLDAKEHAVREIPMVAPDSTANRRRVVMRSKAGSAKPVGTLHAVAEKVERTACQGFALAKSVAPEGRILAPQVLVDSGNIEERTSGYGTSSGQPSELGDVAVIDESTDTPFEPSLRVQADPAQSFGIAPESECLLPRAAAVDAKRHALFVTCLGSDTLVEYDASSAAPHDAILASWHVGSGPMGVAIDSARGRAVVFGQFDRSLHVVAIAGADDPTSAEIAPTTHIALSRRPAAGSQGDVALGRRLFHTTGDTRISGDGRACASCHPDGRDDSLTWATPDGPRNTPALAGRLAGTAPYAWSGNGESVKGHLTHTFQRLRGAGLAGEELDALVAYVTTMAPPPAPAPSVADKQRARGEAIFHSPEAACSTCHGKGGVAPDGELHDVGSGASADSKKDFDTPSLRFVGGSAPYFHDGRYGTLRELLTKNENMGNTSHLSPADLDALEAYVRSL